MMQRILNSSYIRSWKHDPFETLLVHALGSGLSVGIATSALFMYKNEFKPTAVSGIVGFTYGFGIGFVGMSAAPVLVPCTAIAYTGVKIVKTAESLLSETFTKKLREGYRKPTVS